MAVLIRIIVLILLLAVSVYPVKHYVSPNGNNTTGDSWVNAWTKLDSITANVEAGDSCFFGTGIYRGTFDIVAGTFGNHTMYACSAFADTNLSGTWHFAKIYGSINYKDSTWTQHSGNVYRTHYADTTDSGAKARGGCIAQDDSLLDLQGALVDVDAVGECYIDTADVVESLYVYIYDTGSGYTPGSYEMEIAPGVRCIIDVGDYTPSHVTLYGLQFKYSSNHIINLHYSTKPDSVFIQHCKLSHVASDLYNNAENPCLIYSSNTTLHAEYIYITACSLGYVHNHLAGANHGTGITTYGASNWTIDSCTFYGSFTTTAVMFKNYNNNISENMVVKYNTFDPTITRNGVWIYSYTTNDSIYGNIFKGSYDDAAIRWGCSYTPTEVGSNIYIYNNTIYDSRFFGPTHTDTYCKTCLDGITHENIQFKYNIIYATQSVIGTGQSRRVAKINRACIDSAGWTIIDSNMYVIEDSVWAVGCFADGHWEEDIDHWVDTLGFDSNAVWLAHLDSIYWTDPSNGDFTRTQRATGEHNPPWSAYFDSYGRWPIGDLHKHIKGMTE